MSRYYIGGLELWHILRQKFLLLILAPLLFGLFGILLTLLCAPAPLYRSVCTLAYENGVLSPPFPSSTQPTPALQCMGTRIPPIKSIEVLTDAMKTLDEPPKRAPSQKDSPKLLLISLIEKFQSGISVREGQLANTFDIEVIDQDPDRSQKIANAVATSYITRCSKEKEVLAAEGLRPIEKHLEEVRGRLQQAQEAQSSLSLLEEKLELDRLRWEVEALRETTGILGQVKRDVQIEVSRNAWTIRILKPATLPESPINPPKVFSRGGLWALAGLLLGLLGALLAGHFDPSLGVLEDAERTVGLPVLGVIPWVDMHRGKMYHKAIRKEGKPQGSGWEGCRLTTHLPSDSSFWESFRTLRARILSGRRGEKKTLLLTGVSPQEGRTLSAVNLAMVSAQSGMKTLLVDADLRRPGVARYFGLDEGPGLTDVLAGSLPWQDARRTVTDLMLRGMSPEEVMRTPGLDNLHILTSGPVPDNPGVLLESEPMETFLWEVRESYDLVILDCSSSLSWADAAILGPRVDGVLLLYRVGVVMRRVLKRASARLAQVDCRLMGLVLNGMRPEFIPEAGEVPPIRRPPDARVLPAEKEKMEPAESPAKDTMEAQEEKILPLLKLDNGFRTPRWVHILVGLAFFGAGLLWLGGMWNPLKSEKPDRPVKIPPEQEVMATKPPDSQVEAPSRHPIPDVPSPPESSLPTDSSSSSPSRPGEKVETLSRTDLLEVLPAEGMMPAIESPPLSYPYSLYLGSFKTLKLAKRALALYGREGLTPYWSRVYFKEKGLWYRIYVGAFRAPGDALSFMRTYGLKDAELKKTRYGNLIGEYSKTEEWEAQMGDLTRLGYSPYGIPAKNGKTRIIVGAYLSRAGAERQNEDLKTDGIDARVIER